jgi:hypothetical protein
VLCFGLFKARFARDPLQLPLWPAREGLAEIDGLHITLESGHWLFVCDAQGLEEKWLEMTGLALRGKEPGGLLETRRPCNGAVDL